MKVRFYWLMAGLGPKPLMLKAEGSIAGAKGASPLAGSRTRLLGTRHYRNT